MRELLARLYDWLRRDRLDAELTEELRFHRERLTRDASGEGVPPDDAAFAGQRRLGNVSRIREDARERWSVPWLDHFSRTCATHFAVCGDHPGSPPPSSSRSDSASAPTRRCSMSIDQLMFRPFAYLRDPATVHRVYSGAADASDYSPTSRSRTRDISISGSGRRRSRSPRRSTQRWSQSARVRRRASDQSPR